MTNEQAVQVARDFSKIDGGCPVCSGDAADALAKVIPEHPWTELVEAFRDGELCWPLPKGYGP